MAVSAPFFTPSAQLEGVTQTPPEQLPLVQSAALPQALPSAHLAQVAPPQSMSDSVPFFTASEQVGAGAAQTPPEQFPLEQSPLAAQVLPLTHLGQTAPPQSTSVSVPF